MQICRYADMQICTAMCNLHICGNDILNHPDIPRARSKLATCPPDDAHSFVDAHTWAICDQRKNGIWGSDTCHDVHMLQKKCHKKVDQMLLKSQAAERRAEAAKARAGDTTKKRTYTEIDESDADEQEDEERGRGARSCS